MHRSIFYILLSVFILCFAISAVFVFGQEKSLIPLDTHGRDPFVPLIDAKGGLRKNFQKPLNEVKIPEVNLMGISKINNTYYAIIDGEWLKEKDIIKEMLIKKIDVEKVTLLFGEKEVELKLNTEKK